MASGDVPWAWGDGTDGEEPTSGEVVDGDDVLF